MQSDVHLCMSVDHAIQHVFVYLWIMQSNMSLCICGSCNPACLCISVDHAISCLSFFASLLTMQSHVHLCISVAHAISCASLHLCGPCSCMCVCISVDHAISWASLHLCGPCKLMDVFASLWTMQSHGHLCISVDHAV